MVIKFCPKGILLGEKRNVSTTNMLMHFKPCFKSYAYDQIFSNFFFFSNFLILRLSVIGKTDIPVTY